MELHLGLFYCSSCPAARALTAKDTLCDCTRGRLLDQRGHGRWDHSLLPTRSIPGECAFHGSKKPGHPPGRCPVFGPQRLSCKASLKATD